MRFLRMVAALPLTVGVLALAACGGGGGGSSSGSSSGASATTGMTPAQKKAAIRRVWEEFFDGSTAPGRKIALLQSGQSFATVIRSASKSSLAKKTSAKVSAVTLESPHKARVRYSVAVAGQTALPHATGTAVEVDGAWKVGDASFCRLLGLQGSAPAACNG